MDVKRSERDIVGRLEDLDEACRLVRIGRAPLGLDIDQVESTVREAIEELKKLGGAGPCHQQCVHEPVSGYPHRPDCPGCRIEKTCYKCGHFVDLLSKHR